MTFIYLVENCYEDPNKVYIGKTISSRKNQQKELLKDPIYKLQNLLKCHINKGLKTLTLPKNKNALEITGLESWKHLKEHIESQFTEGMTWSNHGHGKDNTTWHLDHIVPISSAQTEEDVYRLNHYTNLRPMWGSDNIRKSNKLLED